MIVTKNGIADSIIMFMFLPLQISNEGFSGVCNTAEEAFGTNFCENSVFNICRFSVS